MLMAGTDTVDHADDLHSGADNVGVCKVHCRFLPVRNVLNALSLFSVHLSHLQAIVKSSTKDSCCQKVATSSCKLQTALNRPSHLYNTPKPDYIIWLRTWKPARVCCRPACFPDRRCTQPMWRIIQDISMRQRKLDARRKDSYDDEETQLIK